MPSQSQQIARLIQVLLRRTRGRAPLPWIVAAVALLVGYLLAQPYLERSLGVSLPGITDLPEVVAEQPSNKQPSPQAPTDKPPRERWHERSANGAAKVLRDRGRDVYESPAGLRYTRGSQHGHRLKHVLAHAADEPDRPGQHGVFEPQDADKIVLLVDEAYEQALMGRHTNVEREQKRDIYTVDLRRRIGYIGGQSGARRGHPPATHLKLVVQGKNVITAFPITP